jgi:hypothetical protein
MFVESKTIINSNENIGSNIINSIQNIISDIDQGKKECFGA